MLPVNNQKTFHGNMQLPDTFIFQLEMNPSIIMKVVKGVKMRVITPDPDTDYSLNLDGEVYDMSEPKVYVK